MIYSLLLAKGGLFDPIAKPLAAVLAFFYDLVPNYGIAIVLLTIAMMIVLTPLTIKQTRSMLVMQKLQPEMKKLQELHKNDRQALNEAVMALYKEHNASPLGGCLPMLLPFPLFIALLRVLEGLSHTVTTTVNGVKTTTAVPKYLTAHTKMAQDIVKAHGQLDAFGMNLAKSARNVGGGFGHTSPYFVLLLVMVGTQFYQQYQLTSRNPAAKSQPGQAAMMKFIPLFFGLISLNFPAGVVVYWTVSNIIRIGQQWALYRYDPKVKALVAKDIKEIEAKTREIDDKQAKSSGRGRFRDLLSNASEAAADRKNLRGGKNGAQPTGGSSGNKGGTPARGGRSQPGKASGGSTPVAKSPRPGTTPPKGVPTPKGTPSKPGANKGTSQKGVPSKPGGAKPGAPRPGAPKVGGSQSGSPGAGAQKATPPKAPAESKAPAAAVTGAGPKAPAESKAPAVTGAGPTAPAESKAPAESGAAAPAPAEPKAPAGPGAPAQSVAESRSAAESKAPAESGAAADAPAGLVADDTTGGTNGSAKAPVVATDGNGAGAAVSGVAAVAGVGAVSGAAGGGGNGGSPASPDSEAVAGNGAPVKGRTGGGSARNVSGRRRRKGR
jgi:YidC/Oxa1 family membrane protein insertase